MLIVCHGQTTPDVMQDAIISMATPRRVVTMDVMWWEVAASMNLPRYFFKHKLALMRFVLGKAAVGLVASDHGPETWSMSASLHAMGLSVFPVVHMEV